MRGLGHRPPSLSLRGLVSAPISRLTDWIQYHKAHLVKQECGLRVGAGEDDKFLALVLVQFELECSTSFKSTYLITLPIPRSRRRAYFCL
jgi:hypothetical protein